MFAQAGVVAKVELDARKVRMPRDKALALAREATEVVVAKGKKVVRFDMRKSPPSDDDLAAAILGPSGNLRAPAVRQGGKLYVGFSDETYAALVAG
ncbi:MAG: hypothetical protein IT373_01150 [Polyangiaceae bacterium]|nr:hypothetical protein [Polyangiaceae bacterium]